MSQIRITPDEMRTQATAYTGKHDELVTLTGELDSLLTTLQENWEGAASESFATQWEDLRPSFINCQTLVETISSQLNSTAEAMETLDAEISSQMGVQ